MFKSNKHIYAQIIDDTIGRTLVSASTTEKEVKESLNNKTWDKNAANVVGKLIAQRAKEKGITTIVLIEADTNTMEKLKLSQTL